MARGERQPSHAFQMKNSEVATPLNGKKRDLWTPISNHHLRSDVKVFFQRALQHPAEKTYTVPVHQRFLPNKSAGLLQGNQLPILSCSCLNYLSFRVYDKKNNLR